MRKSEETNRVTSVSNLWLPVLVLCIVAFTISFWFTIKSGFLLDSSLLFSGLEKPKKVVFFAGWNFPLFASIITIALTFFLFFRLRKPFIFTPSFYGIFTSWFNSSYDKCVNISIYVRNVLQHGRLHWYIGTIVFSSQIILIPIFFMNDLSDMLRIDLEIGLTQLASTFVLVIGVYAVIIAKKASTALISAGIVGFGVGFVFLLYGALDLAITQILVETLLVVCIFLSIPFIPKRIPVKRQNIFLIIPRIVISLIGGILLFLMIVKAMHTQIDQSVGEWYAVNSYIEGYGRNVVNVILVDFRALDTLGEVVALIIAALGVSALLGKRKRRKTL